MERLRSSTAQCLTVVAAFTLLVMPGPVSAEAPTAASGNPASMRKLGFLYELGWTALQPDSR